jgi:hypothetical protein
MNKETQILLGVGALALVGYFVWKNNQPKKKGKKKHKKIVNSAFTGQIFGNRER